MDLYKIIFENAPKTPLWDEARKLFRGNDIASPCENTICGVEVEVHDMGVTVREKAFPYLACSVSRCVICGILYAISHTTCNFTFGEIETFVMSLIIMVDAYVGKPAVNKTILTRILSAPITIDKTDYKVDHLMYGDTAITANNIVPALALMHEIGEHTGNMFAQIRSGCIGFLRRYSQGVYQLTRENPSNLIPIVDFRPPFGGYSDSVLCAMIINHRAARIAGFGPECAKIAKKLVSELDETTIKMLQDGKY